MFVAFSATQMFLDRKPKPTRTLPGAASAPSRMGGLIGLLSSLVGAGGAFVSVPFMTWCNVKIHDAVGTSAALGFPIALAGTLGYVWAGRDLPQMPPGSVGYLYLPGLVVHLAGQHQHGAAGRAHGASHGHPAAARRCSRWCCTCWRHTSCCAERQRSTTNHRSHR